MKNAIYLHQDKLGAVRRGHPWIFPKAVARQTGHFGTGDLVEISSLGGDLIGVGVYNEHSMYRVRLLAYAEEWAQLGSMENLLFYRIEQALLLRQNIGLPNESTNAYRLFNSEGDGLSGLTVDRFHQTCVVSSSAYWVQAHKDVISQIILEVVGVPHLVWIEQTKSLSQDGWKVGSDLKPSGTEEVLEAGVRYQIDFSSTQKTGLFLDQRDNHQRVADIARGKRVLDLYTYTGGFALHAARAGATKVTAIDSSAAAIVQAQQNAALNHLETIEFIEGDARTYLETAGNYDLIILDPPKLSPSMRHIQQAKNYYRFLHREVMKSMRPGSLLMTCNCSSALGSQAFSELVSQQAKAVGKVARLLGVFGPASCHPTLAAFPEGHYLTAILLAV
ncbi:MAG: class I SAM-dependent rRNA methyltransferase [Legionellales bacterium]|nr:class I SAM-dependent rRNA methyltransferase [Legionellales bacterium]